MNAEKENRKRKVRMMKADSKRALQDAFAAPEPVDKQRFLKTIPRPQISHLEFMLQQVHYIRKRIWAISVVVLGIILLIVCFVERFIDRDVLWVISSMMPFLALTIVTEHARSAVYGMEELEMASRFSLKSVVLARLGIIGMFHFLVVCLLIPFGFYNSTYTLFQTGVYLIVPYLLTTVLGLEVVRKIHGKESIYICMGIAAIVSGLYIILSNTCTSFYKGEYFGGWIAVLTVLLAAIVMEGFKIMKQTEDAVWSLQ